MGEHTWTSFDPFPFRCMRSRCAQYPVAHANRSLPITATASRARQKLPAVRRSLAGLPVHRAPGGLLIVPVLQPATDNIPFGLALSLQSQASASLPGVGTEHDQEDLYELQYVLEGQGELRAKSGLLQSIAAGDSILAPIGRAWCQLAEELTPNSDLAVLKLLVPGSLPHDIDTQQGLIDGASKVLADWQSSPVVGNLLPAAITALLAGAKKQAVLAVDSWQNVQTTLGIVTSAAHDTMLSTHAKPVPASTDRNAQAPSSGRIEDTVSTASSARTLQSAQHLLKQLVGIRHWMTNSAKKGPFAKLLFPDQCVVKKTLAELSAFQLPNQTNRLALMFDPLDHEVPFTFGLEIFERSHKTKPHTHAVSHELFFILAGDGIGFCDGERFPVTAGDVVVFPPTSLHGIDNGPNSKMYCLELMLPNDMFAEFVRQGQPTGKLQADDMCIMIAQGCASP